MRRIKGNLLDADRSAPLILLAHYPKVTVIDGTQDNLTGATGELEKLLVGKVA